jgi:hypothetical protein
MIAVRKAGAEAIRRYQKAFSLGDEEFAGKVGITLDDLERLKQREPSTLYDLKLQRAFTKVALFLEKEMGKRES